MHRKKKASVKKSIFFRSLLILILCITLPSVNVFGTSDSTVGIEDQIKDQEGEEKTEAANETAEIANSQEAESQEEVGMEQKEEEVVKSQGSDEASAEQEEEPARPLAKGISTFGTTAVVSAWDQFVAALGDEGVSVINVQADLTRTATGTANNPGTIARDLTIIGNGNTINFGSGGTSSNGIILGAPTAGSATLILSDVYLVKTQTPATPIFNQVSTAASSNWNIMLEDVRTGTANAAGLIAAENAPVTVYGTGNSLSWSNSSPLFNVSELKLVNNAALTVASTTTSTSTSTYSITVGGDLTMEAGSELKATSVGASLFGVGGNLELKAGSTKLTAETTATGQTNYQFNVTGNFVMGEGAEFTTTTASTSNSATYYQVAAGGSFKVGKDAVVTAQSVRKSLFRVGGDFELEAGNTRVTAESTATNDSYYQFNVTGNFVMGEGTEFNTTTATTSTSDTYYQVAAGGNFTMGKNTVVTAQSAGRSLFGITGDFTVGESAELTANSTNGANRQFFVKNFTAETNSVITTTSVGATYQFYITGNFTMESNGAEGTGSSLTANSSGASNSVIYMQGGEVNLRKFSTVTIKNAGTRSNDLAATGSNGIYGSVTSLNLEAESTLDIYAYSVGYRTNTTNYLTMVDGAVFKAEAISQAAIMLQDSASDSTNNPAFINISGEGTQLSISTRSTETGNIGAAMIVSGDNTANGSCRFNVTDGAQVIGYSQSNSVIQVRSNGSVFTVKDGGRIELTQDGNANNIVAALRFRIAGNQSFVVDNGEVYIHKTGGNCPAVRLYGGNNSVTVTNGGNFEVYNEGNGSPSNGTGDTANQGILYTNGATSRPDSFTVTGYGSKVEIVADYGPAIYNNGGSSSITVEDRAIFIATGRTSSATNGTINSSGVTAITLDHPLYFDIRNNRPGGGNAIDAGNTNSTFTTVQSDLSVWKKGSDLDGNPSATWSLFDYSLSGSDFRDIVSTNVPEEFNTSTYGRASDYARISANNASAVIDELRVPTDADKYIYGHAYVPEGLETQRDAWTDEVYVTVQVKDTNGNTIFTGTGTTVGAANDNSNEGLSVYGEPERAGIFKIMYDPDGDGTGDYLPAGYVVEVTDAWRGGADSTSNRVHTSTADDLRAVDVTTHDVTPPTALTASNLDASVRMYEGDLTTRTQVISGTAGDIGATVYLYKNNVIWETTTVGADGKWSITLPGVMAEGDTIAIALNDNVPNTNELTSYDLAKLADNGIYANNGNENPPTDFAFHDAVFDGRLELGVIYYGVLELTVSSEISYGTHGISPGQKSYPAQAMALQVEDSRVFRNEWELTARLEEPFTLNGGSDILNVDLVYSYNGTETDIGSSAVNIWRHTNTSDVFDVYDQWTISGNGNGLFVKASAGKVKTGAYTAKVNWVLSDVP